MELKDTISEEREVTEQLMSDLGIDNEIGNLTGINTDFHFVGAIFDINNTITGSNIANLHRSNIPESAGLSSGSGGNRTPLCVSMVDLQSTA